MENLHELTAAIIDDIFKRVDLSRENDSDDVSNSGPIGSDDLPKILRNGVFSGTGAFNCYPGFPDNKCYELAVFIALESPSLMRNRKGHLSSKMAMELIVQHMSKFCSDKTKNILFLTDNWNAQAAENWRDSLIRIKKQINFEIYLINGRKFSLVKI